MDSAFSHLRIAMAPGRTIVVPGSESQPLVSSTHLADRRLRLLRDAAVAAGVLRSEFEKHDSAVFDHEQVWIFPTFGGIGVVSFRTL